MTDQEQFEAWIKSPDGYFWPEAPLDVRQKTKTYANQVVRCMYESWVGRGEWVKREAKT